VYIKIARAAVVVFVWIVREGELQILQMQMSSDGGERLYG